MAAGELLSALVRAHFDEESAKFTTILNQVIAAEARAGHSQVAQRLRDLRDSAPSKDNLSFNKPGRAIPLARTAKSLDEIIEVGYSEVRLRDLILSPSLKNRLETLVVEQRQKTLLEEHGLQARRRVLLHGPPGTGKTMSAYAIAGELGLPIARVRLEVLFSRYLGETASTLNDIFNEATRLRAVYLFDEFDALGSPRTDSGDVGEMRRIVGTFLQLLDADRSDSIFVAATNIPSRLDAALFRRFDDIIEYDSPSRDGRFELLTRALRASRLPKSALQKLANTAEPLSLADLTSATNDARKSAVLSGQIEVTEEDVAKAIVERVNRMS